MLVCGALAIGCGQAHEPIADAGQDDAPGEVRRCEDVAFAPDGTRCRFEGTCREERGCCMHAWTCVDGAVQSETVCAPDCLRTCEDALARGAAGDACEGAYYCSQFSSDLCCSHSVECAAGTLRVEDSCTPGCGADG